MRQLSIYEYYNQLQLEYLSAEIRSKIYKNESDVKYWQTIMAHKRNKILDIALRNKLQSIFDSKEKYNELISQILVWGIPKLQYRDIVQERRLKKRDLYHYFKPGTDVKVKNGSGVLIKKIEWYDLDKNLIKLKDDLIVNINDVCRLV